MKLLGIDFGARRIGVAVTDDGGQMAFPHSVVENNKYSISNIAEICNKEKIEKIIIGNSIDYKGEPNQIMSDTSDFGKNLNKEIGIPVVYEDERLSTMAATQIQGRHEKIDASAAALILEGYLMRNKNTK